MILRLFTFFFFGKKNIFSYVKNRNFRKNGKKLTLNFKAKN